MSVRGTIAQLKERVKLFLGPVLLILSFVFVGTTSYLYGVISGADLKQEPMVIERYPQMSDEALSMICGDLADDKGDVHLSDASKDIKDEEDCLFVGSVNGTKYYPPGCSLVERINPQNLRCFSSEQQAWDQGYERTASCK